MTTSQTNVDPRMQTVVEFLRQRRGVTEPIGWDDDLIDTRILDSLAFVEFLMLLEELRGAEIDTATIDVDQFRTLERIHRAFFVESDGPAR